MMHGQRNIKFLRYLLGVMF